MDNYKAVIFDLDGTIINSSHDLGDAVNFVLAKYGYPQHSYQEIMKFTGNGMRKLNERSLPPDHRSEKEIDLFFAEMKARYSEHCADKTTLYDGIKQLLQSLDKLRDTEGLKVAILSNKIDEISKSIVKKLGIADYFDMVLGYSSQFPHKPDPAAALYICNCFKCHPYEVLYVGDSGVDMQTAKSAGMVSVGVTWGFHSRTILQENGAKYIVDKAEQIERFFL